MRTENELTMRNLRNVNQDLQAQVREVKSIFIVSFFNSSSCGSSSSCDDKDH